ncbi:MAG: hypothetical protein P4M12_08900 [Gammaproteobacteria bacterium]|nr:hypothetical protein [Gammaproteobacteria bacterium]
MQSHNDHSSTSNVSSVASARSEPAPRRRSGFVLFWSNVWHGVKKRTLSFGRSISNMSTMSQNISHSADNLDLPNAQIPTDAPVSASVSSSAIEQPVFLNPNQLDPHLVTVGAGPTALVEMIELKRKAPEARLILIERSEHYRRTHTLRLNINTIKYPELKARIKASPHGKLKGNLVFIGVNHLRDIMLDMAREAGITIHYAKVSSREELENAFPNCPLINFGDGAHSTMRNLVFGQDKDFLSEHPMQNVLQLQYTVKGQAKPLTFLQLEASEKLSELPFEEIVSYKKAEDITHISARFYLDNATNKQVPDASEAKPLILDSNVPVVVQKAMSILLNTRGDQDIENAKLTKFKLSAYTSKLYAKNANDRTWLLVGDAAFGVPYFRSLNAGIESATRVADILAKHLINANYEHKMLSKGTLLRINLLMMLKFTKEQTSAVIKDLGVDILKSAVFASASAPTSLQPNRWNKTERAKIKAIHPIFKAANDAAFMVADVQHQADQNVTEEHKEKDTLPDKYSLSRDILFAHFPTTPAPIQQLDEAVSSPKLGQ